MVILKNGDFLRTMKSGFRPFWKLTLRMDISHKRSYGSCNIKTPLKKG